MKEFLETQLKNASQHYLRKMNQLDLQVKAYQSENAQLQRTINVIIGGKTLRAAVATVFTVEKDIYKVWRVF